jgi:formate C-acetyltransferase
MEMAVVRSSNQREVNSVNVLTERVKKRRQEYLNSKMHICAARSRLVTKSWKETDGQPAIIRAARSFQKIMEEHPVVIHDGELIVGSQTKYVRGASPPVEWGGETHLDAVKAALKHGYRYAGTTITENDAKSLFQDLEYWKDKSVTYAAQQLRRKLVGDIVDDYHEEFLLGSSETRQPSAQDVDYQTVANKGLKAIVGEAREELTKLTECSPEQVRKVRFLEAAIIALEAAIRYAKRHAEVARELAKKEDDLKRKQELERIAEVCEWVPENPARTFHEALQATQFALLAMT